MPYAIRFIPLDNLDNCWLSEDEAEEARDKIASLYGIRREAFRIVEVSDHDDDYDDIHA